MSVESPSPRDERPPGSYTPVTVPNGATLPWRLVNGAKVYHLIAQPFTHEFAPGLRAECWGYNGTTPGPLIEAVEGDHVRIYVTNRLPEATAVHWHGLFVPNGMDGVAGLTQLGIPPDETFLYEFTLRQSGTYMYHSHFDEMVQMGLGTIGMFVVHPRAPLGPPVDRDFSLMLSEWAIKPGTRRPDPTVMTDFNIFTVNGKVFPATAPLVVRTGQRVRIRLGNLGATDHHPFHIHGHAFRVTGTDAGRVPESAWVPAATVLVPVGSTRDIEFVADAPGDWPFHCHMTHHTMNQMGHGLPNMLGVKPSPLDGKVRKLLPDYMTMGERGMGNMGALSEAMGVPPNSIPMLGGAGPFGPIDMGGMFTILKVRDGITTYEDPGWYRHPAGTVAGRATPAALREDGITL